ncbi:hypothetical protein KIK06_14310 [Nocardiopsis sp. EMB25]|uniref:hypothetical protein n=1 Tax=Nocardiopsis sp. EMB25 TaxID=2835867 RepID=UPI0022836E29|nr:hypothetical protein [Nocardiopsis sp. EMB25]MCY9785057.1 hypothetical protein [Nocardiopsis sp. EMB25]
MRIAKRLTCVLSGLAVVGSALVVAGAPASAEGEGKETAESHSHARPFTWGVIGRNTLGSPNAVFRDGPFGRTDGGPAATQPPPFGRGSLGIIVADGTEKIDFGNETDFAGLRLADIRKLNYWIFVGMDSLSGVSLPGALLEVNPGLDPNVTFSSLVYLPESSNSPSAPATPSNNVWQKYRADADGSAWFATGATGPAIGCTGSSPCSFAELKEKLPDAEITFSLAISKGRDNAFVGAVDGLRINEQLYDFEPFGVRRLS